VAPNREHKFVLFPSIGTIINAGIRAAHSFPTSYVVGINLTRHYVHRERVKRVVELLDTESKDVQRYITEPFTVPTTKRPLRDMYCFD